MTKRSVAVRAGLMASSAIVIEGPESAFGIDDLEIEATVKDVDLLLSEANPPAVVGDDGTESGTDTEEAAALPEATS